MLPGFSAASSLYQSRYMYAAASLSGDVAQLASTGGTVIPANGDGRGSCGPGTQYCIDTGECVSYLCPPHARLQHYGGPCAWYCYCDASLCPPGQVLAPGASVDNECPCVSCKSGTIPCHGTCIDSPGLLTDPNNCGSCGNKCLGGSTCQSGTCRCQDGDPPCGSTCCGEYYDCCNGGCVNYLPDPNNCGGCGITCPTGETCQNGTCTCGGTTCPPGQACCNGNCTGACDNACLQGQECCNGICINVPNLIGSGNYTIGNCTAGECSFINGLTVTLTVNDEMIAEVTGGGLTSPVQNGGFGVQLNAWPSSGQAVGWMQYSLVVQNSQALGWIEYWEGGSHIDSSKVITPLPSNIIHAGSLLKIALSNNSDGSVSGATFTVIDPTAGISGTVQVPVPNLSNGPAALFPIYAFWASIVGPDDGEVSTFSSGAGTIEYELSNGTLCLQGDTSTCTNVNAYTGTGEDSNLSYTVVDPCCGSPLTQTFGAPQPPPSCPNGATSGCAQGEICLVPGAPPDCQCAKCTCPTGTGPNYCEGGGYCCNPGTCSCKSCSDKPCSQF